MTINEYTNSLIKDKRESIKEATVEELKKAAAQYANKTEKVNKGIDKVASIANRIKSRVNKESTDSGSGVGKKIAAGAGAAGITLAGAGIIAKKIADKKKEKEQENVAESVLKIMNESEKSSTEPSNISVHNTMIQYVYKKSYNIDKYNEKCKATISDFKKRLEKYLSTFSKDHLEIIKDDFEFTDLKDDGYEIPSENDIRSRMKISGISFHISSKGDCSYNLQIIANKVPSGSKNITVKTTFKIKYDKENNWLQSAGDKYTDEYQMDTDYHRN